MSNTPANTDDLTKMVTQSKTSHWCEFTKTWPYPEICITCGEEAPVLYDSDTCSSGDTVETGTEDPVIPDTSKSKNVYAAVRSTPFAVKASKKKKVVKSKKPKIATKKAVEINKFHRMLFKDFPLFLPASPPFSDGQINEFLCEHCGRHRELDDETWNACPYAIFHGLIKDESNQPGDQSSVFSSYPNPKPEKSEETSNNSKD